MGNRRQRNEAIKGPPQAYLGKLGQVEITSQSLWLDTGYLSLTSLTVVVLYRPHRPDASA